MKMKLSPLNLITVLYMNDKLNKKGKLKLQKPKYDYWSNVDGVELWEAVHLFYDQEPKRVIDPYDENFDENGDYIPTSVDRQYNDEQYEMYLLGENAIESGIFSNYQRISLRVFFDWAKNKGFPKEGSDYSEKLYNLIKENISDKSPSASDNDVDHKYIFRKCSNDVWEFAFKENRVFLKHKRGFDYLKQLLISPNKDVNCFYLIDLFGNRSDNTNENSNEDSDGNESTKSCFSSDDKKFGKIDVKKAEEKIINEMNNIKREIEIHEETKNTQDVIELEDKLLSLQKKFDTINSPKSNKYKQETTQQKQARQNVCNRIKDAISYLKNNISPLGDYLKIHISTGGFCTYREQEKIEWVLG